MSAVETLALILVPLDMNALKQPSKLSQIFRNRQVEKYETVSLNSTGWERPWTHQEMSTKLCWLNFFTIDRDNPGLFLGTFLLLNGWPEHQIGIVAFVKEIVFLLFQTPTGDLIDKTTFKREYLAIADIVLAITSLTFIFYHSFGWVVFCVMVQGLFLTISPPALYSITLGMVGSRRLAWQSGENETYKHTGTAIRALLIGVCSYYGEDYWIFVVVVLSAAVAVPLVMKIKPAMIDDNKARGMVPNRSGQVPTTPTAYRDIVQDRGIVILLMTVFFYHLGNAGMLPLLNQHLALDHNETGVLISALNLAIAHLLIIPSAILVGAKTDIWGTKALFLLGLILNPIRGLIIISLINDANGNTETLILTQVFNGLSEGIYFVVVVVIAERLSRGSGRFSFVCGLVNTSMAVAGAFSNLISNGMVASQGYSGTFVFLTVVSVVPIFLYGFFMPELPAIFPDTGDTLSNHGTGLSVSAHDNQGISVDMAATPVSTPVKGNEEEGEIVCREDIAVAPEPIKQQRSVLSLAEPSEVMNPITLSL